MFCSSNLYQIITLLNSTLIETHIRCSINLAELLYLRHDGHIVITFNCSNSENLIIKVTSIKYSGGMSRSHTKKMIDIHLNSRLLEKIKSAIRLEISYVEKTVHEKE